MTPVIERKSGPLGSKLTSPGSKLRLLLLSCQTQLVAVRLLRLAAVTSGLTSRRFTNMPYPPLSTDLPSPKRSSVRGCAERPSARLASGSCRSRRRREVGRKGTGRGVCIVIGVAHTETEIQPAVDCPRILHIQAQVVVVVERTYRIVEGVNANGAALWKCSDSFRRGGCILVRISAEQVVESCLQLVSPGPMKSDPKILTDPLKWFLK